VPRARILPLEDSLLSALEACGLVHVSRSRWDAYARRHPALRRGRRIVQANPNGKGVARWLRSAVIEHMHDELERDRAPEPEEVPADREEAS
jgi:hypothetical protein